MPTVTLVHRDSTTAVPGVVDGDSLRLVATDLTHSTGWEVSPSRLCRGPICVPLRAETSGGLIEADGTVDLAVLAKLTGHPLVHDQGGSHWVLGRVAAEPMVGSGPVEAPDFTLPDIEGRPYSLASARGRKVLIISWASW